MKANLTKEATMPAASARRPVPVGGDRVDVHVLRGYKLSQNRPFECRGWSLDKHTGHYSGGCKCGTCDGETTTYPGTVERVIYWADNSVEAVVKCDDGETRTYYVTAPHGDVC